MTPDPKLPPASETATPLTDAKAREIAPLSWESSFKHMLAFAQCLEGALAAATRELDSLKEERTQFMSVIKSDTQAACDLIAERDQLRSDLLLARQQGEEMRKYLNQYRQTADNIHKRWMAGHLIAWEGYHPECSAEIANLKAVGVIMDIDAALATPSPQGNNGEQKT